MHEGMRMCELVKWLIRNALIGYALAGVLVACMWLFNVGNFIELIGGQAGWLGLLMLFVFTGGTFACWQISIALMLIGEGDNARPNSGLLAVRSRLLSFVREKHSTTVQKNPLSQNT